MLPYYRRNLRIAFPVMLTQLGGVLVGLIDSVMVGHYSTTDLAAVSFANGIFFTVMVFATGAVMGVTPLTAYAFVQGDHEGVSRMLRTGWDFTCTLTALSCLLLVAAIPFLGSMGQDPDVVIAARPYYITRIIGFVPFMLFCLCKQFLEGLGNTFVAMVITTVCNVLNVILNYILIFGHCGFSPLGAYGAGLASLIACALMPLCFLFALLEKKKWRRYLLSAFHCGHSSLRQIKELAKVGVPIGIQTFVEAFIFTISFIMVGWLGKETQAAHMVSNQVADLTFMLALGIGSATTIRVSHQYGVHNYKAMKMAARASVHLVLCMNAIGATLMISLRHYIPLLFSNDPEVIDIVSRLLVYAAIFQFSDGLQCVGAASLRGIADVRRPMVYAFISYILIALPIGYLAMFPLGLGVDGMWLAFIIALAMAAVFFHTRFWRLTAKWQ